jgi:hypothetical protein
VYNIKEKFSIIYKMIVGRNPLCENTEKRPSNFVKRRRK